MIPIKIGNTTVLMPMHHSNNGGGEVDPTVAIVLFIIVGIIGLAVIGWLIWESFKD
jgi:hypothetical protein